MHTEELGRTGKALNTTDVTAVHKDSNILFY